ncbi:MAG: dihydrofolate reductase [Candidatus Symbiothrix sp.]|nr:dihydrofolate reductase [Candidatus Symbiothrix sp.]
MKISIIAALGQNNEIGKENALLCHLPADLKRFKALTTDHSVVMGRKTYESLPVKPLPYRRNIVISRNPDLQLVGAEIYASPDLALLQLKDEDEIFIIGGAQLYQQTLSCADKLYLTHIEMQLPDADAYFPVIDYKQWRKVWQERHPADEQHPYAFTFAEYERKF